MKLAQAQDRLDDQRYEKVADRVADYMLMNDRRGHRFALRYLTSVLAHPALIGWNPEFEKCCELGFLVVSENDSRLTVVRCPKHEDANAL
jgi:hypothetical protein